MIEELAPERLRRTVDPASLGAETTGDLEPVQGIVGQKRAVSALRFGLGIRDAGFNIYVAGPAGIGKMTAVQSFIEELARKKSAPPDWCQVNNFGDPHQPRALRLPAGRGRRLEQDLERLVRDVRRDIPRLFESDEYGTRRDEIVAALNRMREEVLERLSERTSKAGFALEATSFGLVMVPVRDGKPLGDAEIAAMTDAEREALHARREGLQSELKMSMKRVRELERAAHEKIEELDRNVALFLVGDRIEDLGDAYRDLPEVLAHLEAVKKNILENLDAFKAGRGKRAERAEGAGGGPGGPGAGGGAPAPDGGDGAWAQEAFFRRYAVNVLVDNGEREGAPVLVELNPSYANLFGRIEREVHFGALHTDFTMIRAGSLHRANGGYLVLPVEDLLRNLGSWDGLKRALRSREIQIEDLGERLGLFTAKSLRPQPIPLDLKVVLVGRPLLYYLLHTYDEEFAELFKVKADFDTRMDRTPENERDFLAVVCAFCAKENLRHLDRAAAAKVLEHASRLAEDQAKISTHFGALGDVVREASFWAGEEGAETVGAAHVQRALDERVYRVNLLQERIQEMIARGALLIDTDGEAVGQVNGLSVLSLGELQFGKPSRITASVSPGRGGIVDIEREVELGGPIHSKGVLILAGYLAGAFARERPLSMAARLVFEQSYEGVEGDSASSAELYAILSALAGVPLKQGIAVTGSVNQRGEVQAIGGVNHKIEGFFDVCRLKGLTGAQGVLVPRANVENLMLREDIVASVAAGQFHVWAAATVGEGIEALSGVPFGERGPDGRFPEGTLGARVEARLRAFAERLREERAGESAGAGSGSR